MSDDRFDEASDALTRRAWLERTGRLAAGLGLGLAGVGALGGKETGLGRAAHAYQNPTAPQAPAGRAGANDTVVLALIGCGGMGRNNMRGLMNKPGVTIGAVCDPDDRHMAAAVADVTKANKPAPAQIKDFRKVLERKDIDGVIIGTPDHWHALPTIMACQADKEVFCEKPISHNIHEGRVMVDAARKHNKVIQVNTWQRSTQHFVDAIDYVRSGKIGKVAVCRAWKVQDPKAAVMGRQQPKTPPSELDYDLWVGPAEKVAYQDNRCHYNFRWYFNYAGGMTGDWGVHMMDIVLLGMSADNNLVMPRRVSSYGGKMFTGADDDRTTPDTQMAIFEFPGSAGSRAVPPEGWLLQWEVHVGPQTPGNGLDGGRDHGSLFIGTEGRVLVDRSGWTITDKDGKPVEKPASQRSVGGNNGPSNHQVDWLECLKTRQQPRADIASMHQTTTVCHLANLAYLHGGAIEWDAAKEEVTNDRDAMELVVYRREYRKPWSLPKL